jgi:NADH-quinone oxidoreductase subunit C
MSAKLEALSQNLQQHLGDRVKSLKMAFGEVTIEVDAADYLSVMQTLRDEPDLCFRRADRPVRCRLFGLWQRAARGAALSLPSVSCLSISRNWRLRVRCFAPDDDFPSLPSVTSVWNSVNWFEREAFDLFGIVFPGHEDLRRILTDYGFIGHPFRKDFPISGYVEMRYDPEQQRVIYQPVTIEPREITPRIVREATYGNVENA